MAEQDELQDRFDGGEISGRLSGRYRSEIYRKALRTCQDFEVLPQGSLRRRAGTGTQFALTGDLRTRLESFRMSTGETFMFEFLNKRVNVYQINEESIASIQQVDVQATPSAIGQSELILNGGFSTPDGDKWQWIALTNTGPVTTAIAEPDGTPAGLPAQPPYISFNKLDDNHALVLPQVPLGYASIKSSGDPTPNNVVHRYATILYQRIQTPFDATSIRLLFSGAISLGHNACVRVKISTTDPKTWANYAGGGETFSYLWGAHGGEALRGLGLGDGSPNPPPFTPADLGDHNIAVAGFYWISFQLERSDDGFPSDPGFDSFLEIDKVSAVATYTVPGTSGGAIASIPSPWTANEVGALQFVPETGKDRIIFVHGDHSPWFMLYGGLPGNWQFGDITYTPATPIGWGGAGSNNVGVSWNWLGRTDVLARANWPSAVDFHDGRVIYGGEKAQANRIVMSSAGKSDDMTFTANPGDALDFKLSTKGRIQWIASNRQIMAGTDIGEHSVTGSKGTPLVGDVQARQEYADQSAPVQGIAIGTYVVYASSDLRRVHAASFDFASSGWDVKDLNFSSEHLTAGLIKAIRFASTPDKTIVVLLQDGTLLFCSFDPVEQVLGWWTVNAGGFVCAMTISQGPLGAYAWLGVQRGAQLYLEKLQLSESKGEFIRYLDASSFATSDGNGRLSNLLQLAGQKIKVVGLDGAIKGAFDVNAAGEVLGLDPNLPVYAGLDYTSRAVTLPRDLRFGKSQQARLGAVVNNSGMPKLNGKIAKKTKDEKALPSALYTGRVRAGNLGWTDDGEVTIEQTEPVRTEICALFSKNEEGGQG